MNKNALQFLLPAALAFVLLTGSAKAEETKIRGWSGNDLLAWCTGPNAAECLGYVMGISDAMAATTAFNGRSVAGWQACFNNYPVTGNQMRDIAIRFLRERPQMRHFNAATLVSQALAEAFPCRTATKN
jgi:hypothetical protein